MVNMGHGGWYEVDWDAVGLVKGQGRVYRGLMVKASAAQQARERARERVADQSAAARKKEAEEARQLEERLRAAAAKRAANDKANEKSLTAFYRQGDKIEQARIEQGREVVAIRDREGSVRAAAELIGISEGEAKALIKAADSVPAEDQPAAAKATDAKSAAGEAVASSDAEVAAKAS